MQKETKKRKLQKNKKFTKKGKAIEMQKNKAFCVTCNKDVEYSLWGKEYQGEIRGKKFTYIGKQALCTCCRSLVYVPEIQRYNLEKAKEAYRD